MEEARPRYRGGVGRRKGVGQALQLTHQGFFPPQPLSLGAVERIRSSWVSVPTVTNSSSVVRLTVCVLPPVAGSHLLRSLRCTSLVTGLDLHLSSQNLEQPAYFSGFAGGVLR
jgi:hypothetical protein